MKIEVWHRTNASGKLLFGYDLFLLNPKTSDKDFEWGEDFKGFTITITDPENRYHLKESKFVSFTLSNPKYKFLTVRDYLGLSAE